MNDQFPNASGVLKSVTLRQLMAAVGRQGQLAVDGWAATNPKQVKEWEANGTLIEKAKEAQDQANEARAMYERDQRNNPTTAALSAHEINEIYGGPNPRL